MQEPTPTQQLLRETPFPDDHAVDAGTQQATPRGYCGHGRADGCVLNTTHVSATCSDDKSSAFKNGADSRCCSQGHDSLGVR